MFFRIVLPFMILKDVYYVTPKWLLLKKILGMEDRGGYVRI